MSTPNYNVVESILKGGDDNWTKFKTLFEMIQNQKQGETRNNFIKSLKNEFKKDDTMTEFMKLLKLQEEVKTEYEKTSAKQDKGVSSGEQHRIHDLGPSRREYSEDPMIKQRQKTAFATQDKCLALIDKYLEYADRKKHPGVDKLRAAMFAGVDNNQKIEYIKKCAKPTVTNIGKELHEVIQCMLDPLNPAHQETPTKMQRTLNKLGSEPLNQRDMQHYSKR